MPIGSGEINFVLSGGSINTNPNLSLGGDPSVNPIVGNILFSNVNPEQARLGITQYRCFYVTNDSELNTLYSARLLVQYQVPNGASVLLGFTTANARQRLNLNNFGNATGGSISLRYEDIIPTTFFVDYPGVGETWAGNFQTAIRTVPFLEDVQVSASESGSTLVFQIDFVGTASLRNHPTLILASNSLTYTGDQPTIDIATTVAGSPINSTADSIAYDTTPPNGVAFIQSEFPIGQFRPNDIVPVWVQRITPAGQSALENDGFTFRILGTALPE